MKQIDLKNWGTWLSAGTMAAIAGSAINGAIAPDASQAELEAYNQAGSVTKADVANLRNYALPQSYGAIKSLIGTPERRSATQDVYPIQGTGDQAADGTQVGALARLTVEYNKDNQAIAWYTNLP
jgi:hypothetical protein